MTKRRSPAGETIVEEESEARQDVGERHRVAAAEDGMASAAVSTHEDDDAAAAPIKIEKGVVSVAATAAATTAIVAFAAETTTEEKEVVSTGNADTTAAENNGEDVAPSRKTDGTGETSLNGVEGGAIHGGESPRQQQQQVQEQQKLAMNEMPSQQQQRSAVPPQTARPSSKFRYDPPEFEREYYNGLFYHANGTKPGAIPQGGNIDKIILPPNQAAQLFILAGIPPDRLRMIWNMAVMPGTPYPLHVKPPPAMTVGQFRSAVRLIQLYQNRVTAKDERLRVEEGVRMRPAYFDGVSGAVVPLPLIDGRPKERAAVVDGAANNGFGNAGGAAARRNRRRSSDVTQASGGPSRRRSSTHTVGSSASGLTVPTAPSTMTRDPASGGGEEEGNAGRDPANVPPSEYSMSDLEARTYSETFSRHCASGTERHVYVDAAVALFTQSNLSRDVFRRLWDVVVTNPNTGMLDEADFVLMMHLIICMTRRGSEVPGTLPATLLAWRRDKLGEADNYKP